MNKILTASQMKAYDAYTINDIGIPSMVLMERAAIAVFEIIKQYISDTNLKPEKTSILVVCGNGNNGGDGLALARLLYEYGVRVTTLIPGEGAKRSDECQKELSILQKIGMSVITQMEIAEYDIIIDALFGIGLKRPLEGIWKQCVEELNEMTAYKIAVDIPSGLDADTGCIHTVAFKADLTITFEYLKRGLFLGNGPLVSGRVVTRKIGITHLDLETVKDSDCIYTFEEKMEDLLPYRSPIGNKGTFGKVYIFAGSKDTLGAAILCARGAFASGAGMVKVLCPKEYATFLLSQIPEVMLSCYDISDLSGLPEMIKRDLDWADAVVAGPGIGQTQQAADVLQIIFKYVNVPIVLDADALNILSVREEIKESLLTLSKTTRAKIILTPHVGEESRLLHASVTDIKEHAYEKAVLLSEEFHCIAVCKDAKTLVKCPGEPGYLNLSGNHGMATAGSGDVLAGILGTYAAIGGDLYKNVQKAVYLHGCAGDKAAENVGERALMSSHIIEALVLLQKGI